MASVFQFFLLIRCLRAALRLTLAGLCLYVLGCNGLTGHNLDMCPETFTPDFSVLTFETTDFIEASPWARREVEAFLGLPEVREALGFDPLAFRQIIVELKPYDPEKGFGSQCRERILINAVLYSPAANEPAPDSLRSRMLRELGRDREMLVLYRNLLVTHELAHLGEWYFGREGSPVTLTRHDVTRRMEIKVLANLYRSGRVSQAMCRQIVDFFQRHMNMEGQTDEEIRACLARDFDIAPALASVFPAPVELR